MFWRRKAKEDEPVEMEVVEDDHPATFVPAVPKPPAAPPPPRDPRAHPARAPAMVLTQGVEMDDGPVQRAAAHGPRPTAQGAGPTAQGPGAMAPPPRPPPRVLKSWAQQVREETPPPVPTEWGRRQVGPPEAGRVVGVCSGCNARLSVTDTKPLRIVCPVCGRQKLRA